jgi:hypothetical protein
VQHDELVNAASADQVLAIGTGATEAVILDPHRQVPEALLRRWAGASATRKRVVVLDLVDRTSDYRVTIHGKTSSRRLRWLDGQAQPGEGGALALERGVRIDCSPGALPGSLFQLLSAAGFDENYLDWTFELFTRSGRPLPVREAQAWGPSVMRLMVASGMPPARLLAILRRYAEVRCIDVLGLHHCIGGSMLPSHVAVTGGDDWVALFDESGTLTLDLRWLHGVVAPARTLCAWGPVEAPDSVHRFAPGGAPAPFGFALYEGSQLRRRLMRRGRVVTDDALGFPRTMLAEHGTPLPGDLEQPIAGPGARWQDVAHLLAALGLPSSELESARYDYHTVALRR